jgi:hypothetical protein
VRFLRKSSNTLLEMDVVTHVLSPQQLQSTMSFCCDMGMRVQVLLIPGFEILTITDFSLFIFPTYVILSKES